MPSDGLSSAYELMSKGGVIMWPILLCSIIALWITLWRFYSLRRASVDTREFMDVVRTALRQKRIQDAVQICEDTHAPIARIVKAGLHKIERSKEDIREALQTAGQLEVPRLERYLNGLATCASVAPLLGLLGTVQGMIRCFSVIESKQGQVNPSDLAEGVANALVATFAGLVVAIPSVVAYNYLHGRVDDLVLQLEVSSSELMDALAQGRERESME